MAKGELQEQCRVYHTGNPCPSSGQQMILHYKEIEATHLKRLANEDLQVKVSKFIVIFSLIQEPFVSN